MAQGTLSAHAATQAFCDTLFIDSDSQDFTLQSNSPCIDSGSADLDGDGIDDITDYYGTAPDMGAYEWYSSIIGDLNEDGTLNVLDIVLMINMILSNEYSVVADVNDDGTVDILDIVI